MNIHWWELASSSSSTREKNCKRTEAYFLKHLVRAFLHMPFMLGSPGEGMSQFSYDTTVESARRALVAYPPLRVDFGLDPYLCITLQAFVMLVLLILHLLGHMNDPAPQYTPDENDSDRRVVEDIINIFQEASKDERNPVAKQAVNVLEVLLRARGGNNPCPYGFDCGRWCKMTIPCFGEITVRPGKKLCGSGECPQKASTIPTTAVTAEPSDDQAVHVAVASDPSDAIPDPFAYDTVFMSLDNMVSLPHQGWRTANAQFNESLASEAWTVPVAAGESDFHQEWDLDFFGP
ncbi:hypothetical protein PV11_07899 [Exophiala sideris]|uniref:Uncharacterized protein n=1 Tax=Exophiala sideris TaxID=1016849 RepID=A0A0D1Z0A3_9EURO|nr:hypothetical protein PV11_07899 [Exophiala sideris]